MGLGAVQFRHPCQGRSPIICPASQPAESLEAFAAPRCLIAPGRSVGHGTERPPTPHLQETLFLPYSPWYYLYAERALSVCVMIIGILRSQYYASYYITPGDPASWSPRWVRHSVLHSIRCPCVGDLQYRFWYVPGPTCARDAIVVDRC